MNRALLAASLFCFGAASILLLQECQDAKVLMRRDGVREPPRLQVEPKVLDFGTKPPHSLVELQIQLQNVGDSTIDLLYAAASCGCTTVDFQPCQLAPGVRHSVNIRVTTGSSATSFTKMLSVGYRIKDISAAEKRLIVPIVGEVVEPGHRTH